MSEFSVYGASSNSRPNSSSYDPTSGREQTTGHGGGNSLCTSQQAFLTAEMCASALAARRSAQLPKLKELYGGLSQTSSTAPDSALTVSLQLVICPGTIKRTPLLFTFHS